jgi:hypothetical protein
LLTISVTRPLRRRNGELCRSRSIVDPVVAFAHGKPQHPPQLSPARPATLIGGCEALQTQFAGLPNTVITGSSTIAAGALQVAGQPVPEHCRVTGRMNDRIGLDGRPYAIGFELRLPVEWNGRFWYQGNGGIDGSVVPATGALGGGPLTVDRRPPAGNCRGFFRFGRHFRSTRRIRRVHRTFSRHRHFVPAASFGGRYVATSSRMPTSWASRSARRPSSCARAACTLHCSRLHSATTRSTRIESCARSASTCSH